MKYLFLIILLLHCGGTNRELRNQSETRTGEGIVLDVNAKGDVRIGEKASLIVRADGAVIINGPLYAGDLQVDENGTVNIKDLVSKAESQKVAELQKQIDILELKIQALEKKQYYSARISSHDTRQ